jgi:ubiquinone/menaquinone biosynthesis C-methylase UbiE
VACNRFYNRLVWGYWTTEFHSFCLNALEAFKDGWVLDIGCGSLAFTAQTYVNYTKRPVVFLDQSIKQLQLAKSRIIRIKGDFPANLVFVHADALRLPFKPKSFKTVISLNLLHVLKDIKVLLLELTNILANGGTISLTTLVENNRLADKYLHMWGKAGELVPRSTNLLFSVFDELGISVKYHVKGNMAFINYK